MSTLLTIIVSVISAIIAGVSASFIKPLVDWDIKKKEIRLKERIDLIKNVRQYVICDECNRTIFRETGLYSRIRPFHTKKTIESIESDIDKIDFNDVDYCRGSGYMYLKNMILDELTSLEIKWNII
jgi:hypothetical protein